MQHTIIFRIYPLIFLLLLIGKKAFGEANFRLEDFAYNFYGCLIHFVNYPGVDLNTKIPVVLSNPLSVSVPVAATNDDHDDRYRYHGRRTKCTYPFTSESYPASMHCLSHPGTGPRWNCVAQFYILPQNSRYRSLRLQKKRDLIPSPFDKLWIPESDSPFDEGSSEQITRQLYHIFVKSSENEDQLWKSLLQILYRKKSPGNSMVATFAKNPSFLFNYDIKIKPQLLLINNYKIGSPTTYEIQGMGYRSKRELNNNIRRVHTLANNPDTKWLIPNRLSETADRINADMNEHLLSFRQVMKTYIQNGKNVENLVLLNLAIGSNVSYINSKYDIQVDEDNESFNPKIIFDKRFSHIITSEPKEIEYLTCYTGFKYTVTNFHSLVYLISVFENRIWLAILVCYIFTGSLLSLIYHIFIKKRVTNPFKFCPFTFGVRALLNQSADRIHNSKRFGFMAWVVIPWLFAGVVLNHAFRNDNIKALNQPSVVYQRWVSVYELRKYNISVYSALPPEDRDLERQLDQRYPNIFKYLKLLTMFDKNFDFSHLSNTYAKLLAQDQKLAIVSTSDVIAEVISHFRPWVRYTKPYSYNYYFRSAAPNGWGIYNCWDNKVLRNIGILQESGIATMWKTIKKRLGKKKRSDSWTMVYRVSLACNISAIFWGVLYALAIATGVWLLENLISIVVRCCKKIWPKKQTPQKEKHVAPVEEPPPLESRVEEPTQILPPVVVSDEPVGAHHYILDEGLHEKFENLLVKEREQRHHQQLEGKLQMENNKQIIQNLKEQEDLDKIEAYQEPELPDVKTEHSSQGVATTTLSQKNEVESELKDFTHKIQDSDIGF